MRDDEDHDSGGESADVQDEQGRWKASRSSLALVTATHTAGKDYARHWDYQEGSIDLPPLSLPGQAVDDGLAYPGRIAHRKIVLPGAEGAGHRGHTGTMPVGERPSVLPGSDDFLTSVTMASQPAVPAFPPTDLSADEHGEKGAGEGSVPRRVVIRRDLEAPKATKAPKQQDHSAAKVVWSWTKPEVSDAPVFSWNMGKGRKPAAKTHAGKPKAPTAKASSLATSVPASPTTASAPGSSSAEPAESKPTATAGASPVAASADSLSVKQNTEASAPAKVYVQQSPTPVVFTDRPVVVRRSNADWDSLIAGSSASGQSVAAAQSVASGAKHQGRQVCSTPRVVDQLAEVGGISTGGRAVSSSPRTPAAQADHAVQPVQAVQTVGEVQSVGAQPASSDSAKAANTSAPAAQHVGVSSKLDEGTPNASAAAKAQVQAKTKPQTATKSAPSGKPVSYRASSGVLHAVNGQAAFAFVYLAISVLMLMVGSGMILPVIMERVKDPRAIVFMSDGNTLLSVLLALVYACISEWSVIRGKEQRGQDAVHWRTDRRMTLAALLALVAVLLLGQGMVHGLNKFFNHFCLLLHIPSLASRSLLVTGTSSPMMAVYALLAVPLAEELVFRGIILNGLRRFGRVFAILTASLLCALLQCDPVSGLWIFLLGLALGYCSLEYGLVWAIGARVVGNLLFSGLPNRYLMSAPRTARMSILAVALVLVLAGLVMFFLHRASLFDYRRRYRAPKGTYASWRQPWFLLYLLLCLLLTVFKFVPGLL